MEQHQAGPRGAGAARLPRVSVCLAVAVLLVAPALAEQPVAPAAPASPDIFDSAAARRDAQARTVQAYRDAIDDLEAGGAFAPGLAEQLLGLGLALQREGLHEEAVSTFKRGAHVARINEGLYSARQLALLRGEISSHIALGDLEAADERQRYLHRVQVRSLEDTRRGTAHMQHALWQRQAYEAGLGEVPEERLVQMLALHRLALSETADAEGESSPALLPPLYGMLRAHYLLTGFVGETSGGRFRIGRPSDAQEALQIAYRSRGYKQGAAVIRAIYDVRRAQPGAGLRDSAEPMLMLADWNLWHGKRDEAMEIYAQLERELAALDTAQDLRDEFFGDPQPLPALAGVRALPAPVTAQDTSLLLEFAVDARGRVDNLARRDDNAALDELADDLMRRLRQTPFRPQISDGLAVDTAARVVAYDSSNWR
jgi:tetratricopeptide (TPR) repeat protein